MLSQWLLWQEKLADLYRINNPNTRCPRPSWSFWTTKHFWWQIDNLIVDILTLLTLRTLLENISE